MSWHDRQWNRDDGPGQRPWNSLASGLNWAPSLGSFFGIRVQVHILYLIYIAVELLQAGATQGGFSWSLRYQAMLFAIVLLHEFGHCFGARYVGGRADHILMWPLGGLAYVSPPHRPGAHFITAFAGPLVNVILCALTGGLLILRTGSLWAVPWNPFNAYPSDELIALLWRSPAYLWVYQFFYVNYVLFLFNVCLPLYPLDGGRLWQAALWPRLGYRRSMYLATTLGMGGAVVLGVFGLYAQSMLLVAVAVFAFITSKQQRDMVGSQPETDFVDYSSAHQSDAGARPGPLSRWRTARREGAWARKQEQSRQEQAEVDRILAKVHERGLTSLTSSEKKILERATQRQREQDRAAGRIDRL